MTHQDNLFPEHMPTNLPNYIYICIPKSSHYMVAIFLNLNPTTIVRQTLHNHQYTQHPPPPQNHSKILHYSKFSCLSLSLSLSASVPEIFHFSPHRNRRFKDIDKEFSSVLAMDDFGKLALQLFIFCLFTMVQPKLCDSAKKSVLLPLKAKQISSSFIAKPPNKVSFHHNVSLTVSLTVGSPPQQVTMVLDTGSELSWLHCTKTPSTPLAFNPKLSTSYSPVPCSSPTCKTRTRDFAVPVSCDQKNLCHAILSYADASSVEGSLATEFFHIDNSAIPGLVFGCMDMGSSSNPEDAKTTGLIGMNRGSLSFVSQRNYPKFSYCISGRDSSGVLLLGETNLPWLGPLKYTPLVQMTTPLPYFDRVAYTVQLEGIKVSNTVLPLPKSVFVPDHTGAGQTMVDSGTQFTFLLGPAYNALKNEFIKQTKGVLRLLGEPDFVFQGAMDLCYRVEKVRTTLPPLPTVSLMFEGVEMSVSGEKLLYKVPGASRGSDAVYCFTFGNSELLGAEAYIIGHHHQQNLWMEFDIANSRVGLAEVRCDLASQRLGLGR